ncbi:glutamyl-tRNA reductase [soil metagenome]
MTVLLLGANHDTAAVAVRECLAIPAERIVDTLRFLTPSSGELTVISTCNRTEFYAASTEAERRIRDFIYRHSGLDEGTLDHALYRLEGRDAVRHLLRVACGLDSMIVGEPQILGQVREALQLAQEAGSSGPVVTALFQSALNAGKTARAMTGISRGALSVSQSAVDLATDRLGGFSDRTALVIGAGETGAIVAHTLRSRGIHRMIIANRALERAANLAADLHAEAISLDQLPAALADADLVISSTGAPDAVVDAETVLAGRRGQSTRPCLMIDIAMPRDIEPDVAGLPGITVCDLDDLHDLIEINLENRKGAAREIEADIEARTNTFLGWLAGHSSGRTIRDLYRHAEGIRSDQIERALRRMSNLTPREREQLEVFSVQLTNALLHDPVSQIWDRDRGAENADAVRRLFSLGAPEAADTQEDEQQSRPGSVA